MNKKTKDFLVSSGITFVATFLSVIVLELDNLTVQSFKDGTAVALGFTGIRAAAKAMIEFFLVKYTTWKK